MAYQVERGSRPLVGSGGVILVHAAIAYLLLFGLAPPPFFPKPEQKTEGVLVPLPPPPKPDEKQPPKNTAKPRTDDPVRIPLPDNPLTNLGPTIDLGPLDTGLSDSIDLGGPIGLGETLSSKVFPPVGPKPLNDVSRWVTTNEYPRISLNRQEHGTAHFSVAVAADGSVTACRITATSGSRQLDEATCKWVSKRAKFEPATDEFGAKVAGTYSNSVRWVLPR